MKTKKSFFVLAAAFGMALPGFSQSYAPASDVDFFIDPNFAVAILAGVIIAIGVQIFLTALSIASGITAIGDLKEMYVQSRVRSSDDETYMDIKNNGDDESSNTGTKIAAGVGIWAVLTLGISAFVGSLLAMNLVVVESMEIAITVALVIWALFCILVVYFESKLLGVIVGGISNVATSGFKMSTDMISGAFETSKEMQTKNMIDHTIEKVRKELKNEVDFDDLNSVVDRMISKVDKKLPDYGTLKQDLEDMLEANRAEVKANADSSNSSGAMKWATIQKAIDKASDHVSKSDGSGEKLEKLKSFAKELIEAYDSGDSQKESIKNVAHALSPKDEQTTDKYVEQVMNFVSTESTDGINFEKLQETFEEVKKNPSQIVESFSNKIADLNQEKVISLLENNTNYSKDQIKTGAKEVEKYVRWVKQQATNAEGKKDEWMGKIEASIESFFNQSGRPELQYSSLRNDLDKILDNPSNTPRVVRERAEQFSADTLISMLTAHTSLGKEDIDKLKSEVDSTKQAVIDRMTKVESQAKGKIETLKKKAVIQAEHTRAAAAAAAWWLVLTGVLSAAAAVGGALVSL